MRFLVSCGCENANAKQKSNAYRGAGKRRRRTPKAEDANGIVSTTSNRAHGPLSNLIL